MIRILITLVIFITSVSVTQAQTMRRYHQNLPLADVTSLHIDAQGEVELKKWSGSEILIEVTVTTRSGSTAILNHLQKEGRYDLTVVMQGGVAQIVNKQLKRQPIKAKGADMDEHVVYVISVPDNLPVTGSESAQVKTGK